MMLPMENIVQTIDSEIEKRSLLKHAFYQMWSEGKLTVDHLQGYSKEYFQLVKAVPGFVESIASAAADPALKVDIANNAREEAEHIEPWVRFATALGVSRDDLAGHEGAEKITRLWRSYKSSWDLLLKRRWPQCTPTKPSCQK
jgi:pyrroloquinoline-quinone synthase